MNHPPDPGHFAAFRGDLPAVRKSVYLNTAGSGPMPHTVYRTIQTCYERIMQDGAIAPSTTAWIHELAEKGRRVVAAAVGANPEEVAFFRSVAQALGTVIGTMDWRHGDEIIISTEENPAFFLPWFNLAKRRGVCIRKLDTGVDDTQLLGRLDELISSRTRAIALSHVSHITGRVFPIADVYRRARADDIGLFVDGAQAVGQIRVDLARPHCDWYFGIGHKWLFGPDGTAFLYWNRERLGEALPLAIGVGAVESFDFADDSIVWRDDARRFEFGGNPWPLYIALAEAVDWNSRIGIAQIALRARQLSSQARSLIDDMLPEARILTPSEESLASAILTFEIPGLDVRPVVAELWQDRGIIVQWRRLDLMQDRTGIRLSLAWFVEDSELERAIATIAEAVAGRAGSCRR